jgi:hypothetical protein
MAVYSVHLRGQDLSGLGEAAFTREGFDRSAFLAGPFWLARHGLWLAAILWTACFFGLLFLSALGLLSFAAALAIILLLECLFALEASHLLEMALDSRGYHLVEMVAAPAREEAEASFYRRFGTPETDAPAPSGPAGPKGRPAAAPQQDVLGHFPEPGAPR